MKGRQLFGRELRTIHTVLMIIITCGTLLAAYMSTISSLKAEIAGKVDRSRLELLDKKLTRIEVKLEEAILTKNELNRLRDHLDQTIMEIAVRWGCRNEREAENGK